MIARYTSTPRVVHPSYCVAEKLWYTDEGITAKSLQILQLKLPDAIIKDYYPEGYGLATAPKPKRVILDPTAGTVKPLGTIRESSVKIAEAALERQLVVEPKIDRLARDLVQAAETEQGDLFSEPLDVPLFLPEPVEFKKIVPRRNYTRTVSKSNVINWTIPENVQTLRSLMATGMRVVTVAERMGCTKNAIIGACHRNGIQISKRKKPIT